MPNYVTITPKYQIVDLADMLKVPEMITRETKEANKEIEDYKDQISKNRALLGPDADKIFSPYDDLMNTLIDNPTVADRQHIANQLRSRYRDINAKVEAAKPKYDKMTEMFMQHPDYIGNPGSFMDYYNNPNYTPTVVDGAKIATDSAKAMKAFVAKMMPKRIGTLEGDKTKDVYGKGYTPDELSAFVDDAVSGRLQTPEGRTLASILEKNGYGNLQTDAERARAQNYLKQGVAEGFMTTDIMPNAVEQAKLNARYSGSRSSGSGGKSTKTLDLTFVEQQSNGNSWSENPHIKDKNGKIVPKKVMAYRCKTDANNNVIQWESAPAVWNGSEWIAPDNKKFTVAPVPGQADGPWYKGVQFKGYTDNKNKSFIFYRSNDIGSLDNTVSDLQVKTVYGLNSSNPPVGAVSFSNQQPVHKVKEWAANIINKNVDWSKNMAKITTIKGSNILYDPVNFGKYKKASNFVKNLEEVKNEVNNLGANYGNNVELFLIPEKGYNFGDECNYYVAFVSSKDIVADNTDDEGSYPTIQSSNNALTVDTPN